MCEATASAEACAQLALSRSNWCPDPEQCIPGRRLAIPAGAQMPTWEEMAEVFICFPIVTQVAVFFCWILLHRLYETCVHGPRFRKFILNHIGSNDYPIPRQPRFMTLLCMGQILASLWAVAVFVVNCYELSTVPAVKNMNICLGIFQMFHYFVIGLQLEFRLHYLFYSGQLVDVITLPGMLWTSLRPEYEGRWLTLNFLRSIQALHAYERLDNIGALRLGLGEVAHEVILMGFRFMVLIVCFASSIFTLEVLGPMPIGRESLLPTAMGDISFFTMLYWVIETISTVGYGDFAPKTFLSRVTTMGFMVAGVAFFTVEFQRILEFASNEKRGTGVYKKTKRPHIILLGGGVRYCDTSIVLSFLDEVYHPSYRNSWPDLVVLSQSLSIEKVREAVDIHLEKAAQQNITYLVGSPLKLNDLKRTRCETAMLVVIIADTSGHLDAYQEDKLNILRAMSLHTGFPRTPLRLMLLMSESKEKALSVGIREQRVFTLNDIRSGILGASCRCIGLNTLLSNLIVTMDSFELNVDQKFHNPWLENYVSGMDHEVYGLLAADEFHGMIFSNFVLEAYSRCEVCIFAAQIKGKIVLAPGNQYGRIDDRTVFFALAKTEDQIKEIALDGKLWTDAFAANRWRLFEEDDLRRARQSKIHGDLSNSKVTGHLLTPVGGGANYPLVTRHHSAPDRLSPRVSQHSGRRTQFRRSINLREQFDNPYGYADMHEPSEDRPHSESSRNGDDAIMQMLSSTSFGGSFSRRDLPDLDMDTEYSDVATRVGVGSQRCDPDLVKLLGVRVHDIIRNAQKAPFILLLDLSGSWMQVPAFVKQCRAKGLPYTMPIVVLCPILPPKTFLGEMNAPEDPNFSWVVGNPVSAQDLLNAGVSECCVVVCLGLGIDRTLAEGGTDGTEMLDADVVMLQRMLDLIGAEGKHVILEFKSAQNMRLLPMVGQDRQEGWRLVQESQNAKQADEEGRNSMCHALREMFRCGPAKQEQNADVEYCLDPRFASGQVFAPNMLGTLVACEYRMPGMIEMIQMLATPPSASGNFVWQVRLKEEHYGSTYGEVFAELVGDPKEPALPLGLLRRFPESSCGMGYVWTNPGKDTPLQETDLLFVVANPRFGKMAHSLGLLPFQGHGQEPLSSRSFNEMTPRSSPSEKDKKGKSKESPVTKLFSMPPQHARDVVPSRPLSPREPLL